ncbi:MAG TPA: M20/M25/M40 family metallo-hydrolase [Thermoplasmata archaeon]|nr:M20/M25/M40 family metallo-hydrolase [Thermoplasmata archaeon]
MPSGEHGPVFAYVDKRFDNFVADLSGYASVPTISAQGKAFEEGAAATVRLLERYGVKAQRMPVAGGPDLVVGNVTQDPGLPTLALYNHYDVQPVDPLNEWESDPFRPEVRDGVLYGRGVADTKGNTVSQCLAQAAIRETMGRLPVNLRFVVEGEEEMGSPHLLPFADGHPEVFRADGATIEGNDHDVKGRPILYLGCKGILSVEMTVRTASVDQHSSLATVIPNAAWRLLQALDTLRDANGRILIKGFYDGAHNKPTKEETAYLRRNSWDPKEWESTYGTKLLVKGSRPQRLIEHMYRSTCTIDGIWSGYTGEGHKTVNPAVAHAKLDFRLVPGQRPDSVYKKLVAHLRTKGFGDVQVEKHSVFEPAGTPVTSPISRAIIAATEEVYGRAPNILPWMAGSSTTWYFTRVGTPASGGPGVGWTGERIHAPNENIRLPDARNAIKATAAMILDFRA